MKKTLLSFFLVALIFPTASSAATFKFLPGSSNISSTSPTNIKGLLNTQSVLINGVQIIASYTYTTNSPIIPQNPVVNITIPQSQLSCPANYITHNESQKKYTFTIGCITPVGTNFSTSQDTEIFNFNLSPLSVGSITFQFDSTPQGSKAENQQGLNILSPISPVTYTILDTSSIPTPTPTIRNYGTCQGTDTSTCNFPVCPGGCDICRGTPACQNNLCVLAPVTNGTACFVPVSLLEGNCFNGTCQAPATPAPSKTPVPPTPTSVPPTQIPTPTLVIPSPTPISVSTPIDLEISLQGSANLNSIQPRVSVTIKQNNQLVYSNPVVPFTSYYQLTGSSTYRGSVYIPNENFSTGPAEIIIKGPAHLAKKFTVNLIKSQTNSFDLSGAATLKAGDLWGPAGQPDNTIQLGDITAFVSQWTQVSQPVTPSNYLYDLNFDGTINVSDMSLILSNWGTSSPIIFGDN